MPELQALPKSFLFHLSPLPFSVHKPLPVVSTVFKQHIQTMNKSSPCPNLFAYLVFAPGLVKGRTQAGLTQPQYRYILCMPLPLWL